MGFGQVFVQPAMSDGGLAFGGPLLELAERPEGSRPLPARERLPGARVRRGRDAARHPRRGPRGAALRSTVAPADRRAPGVEGRVVARFDGRMEFGPRALGNRSILYHCADATVNDWLNKRLDRTEFMPFAPATIEDEVARELRRARGRGAHRRVHDDHLGLLRRLQARVPGRRARGRHRAAPDRAQGDQPLLPRRARASTESSPASGTVVNTSFNMHEEPIVMHTRGRRAELRARSPRLPRDRTLHRRESRAWVPSSASRRAVGARRREGHASSVWATWAR